MKRPLIAIPIGDPAGIGPEIAVKSLRIQELYKKTRPCLIGDWTVIEQALQFCSLNTDINEISSPEEGIYKNGTIDFINVKNIEINEFVVGRAHGLCGRAAYEYIERAVQLALQKKVDAITTPPINKVSLKKANINYTGHTEILAGLTKSPDPLTMFHVRSLNVFFLTRHMSLIDAIESITENLILEYIVRCASALKRLGIRNPIIAIAGLNPHCGENGLFGNEEIKHIIPAVKEAQAMGYRVEGPISADVVFHLAIQGEYSAVLSLYHDQGHIAVKTFDFEKAISLTLGLPFLRTSVDHGTAFNIAGTGTASEVSMTQAIITAAKYAGAYINNG